MMITDKKVNWSDRFDNRAAMYNAGFVSAKAMHMDYSCRQLKLPIASELRKLAKTDKLECVRCDIGGSVSYWYSLKDLKHLFQYQSVITQ